MQKKAGQISSNTLSLRFMQNAAKAQQDREVDAAKAKVRNEEEWELSTVWKGESHAEVDNKTVSYEQSYLPFLFPGGRPVAQASGTSNAGVCEGNKPNLYKGRRKFGKHGDEQQVSELPAQPPEPSQKETDSLPRGARAISSHGRASASSLKLSQQRRPQLRTPTPKSEQTTESAPLSRNSTPQLFMKPQIDAPKPQKRTSDGSQFDGEPRKKKRKERAS